MNKPILINFTDSEGKTTKTYSACSIKTGAIDNIFEIAERAQQLQETNDIKFIREFYNFLKATLVDIYGGQFSYDELNKGVEQSELMKIYNEICENIKGEMIKK